MKLEWNNTFEDFLTFKENWDSYGGKGGFTREQIQMLIDMVGALDAVSKSKDLFCSPCADGSIEVTSELPRVDLIFAVDQENNVNLWLRDKNVSIELTGTVRKSAMSEEDNDDKRSE